MNEWQTVFRNETGWDYKTQREKQVRMVYVDDVEAGEIVCRILGHPDVKVQEDRARLIASAPTLKQQRDDLLKALKKIQKILQQESEIYRPEPLVKPTWVCMKQSIYTELEIMLEAAITNCEE